MSDKHHYEIELKQGALVINLASDDVYFISKQMDKWFKVLLDDSYVPIAIPEPKPAVAAPAPPPPPPPVELPPEPALVLPPEPAPVPEPAPPPVVETPPPAQAALPPAPPPVLPEPEPEPIPAPPPIPVAAAPAPMPPAPPIAAPTPEKLDSAVQDDFEAVMDTLMRDLEKGDGSQYQATAAALPAPAPLPAPPSMVDLSDISTLSELAERSKASSSEDFLLLTAYYIVFIENGDDKFSLKRINSHLVKSGMTPVNHSVLESTITKNYLTLVPDLTGMADISEYSLSDAGQAYVLKLFT